MTNLIKFELDIAWDFYGTDEYKNELAKYNIVDRLIELEGPGGGNPLVEFMGTEQDLTAWMLAAEFEEDDINYYLGKGE